MKRHAPPKTANCPDKISYALHATRAMVLIQQAKNQPPIWWGYAIPNAQARVQELQDFDLWLTAELNQLGGSHGDLR